MKITRLRNFRWLRFSLRTFLVGVVVLCIYLSVQVKHARDVAAAKAAIVRIGGESFYNYEPDFYYTFDDDGTPQKLVSRPSAGDVLDQLVVHPAVTKQDLTLLAPPPSPTPQWLSKQSGLEFFVDIEEVNLAFRFVSDDDLRVIGRLKGLRYLDLTQAKVTDEGVGHLVNCQQLETLALGQNQKVTDASMPHVARLQKLQQLSLLGSPISDAGLKHLESMSTLRLLDVTNTQVTRHGVHELQSALPECHIIR